MFKLSLLITLVVTAYSSASFGAITVKNIKQKQISLITKQLQSITDQHDNLKKMYIFKSKVSESNQNNKKFAKN